MTTCSYCTKTEEKIILISSVFWILCKLHYSIQFKGVFQTQGQHLNMICFCLKILHSEILLYYSIEKKNQNHWTCQVKSLLAPHLNHFWSGNAWVFFVNLCQIFIQNSCEASKFNHVFKHVSNPTLVIYLWLFLKVRKSTEYTVLTHISEYG